MTWLILLVPAALLLMCGLLGLTAWLEESVLSPRALILKTLRTRRAEPEHVERLVAEQYEKVLRNLARE